MKNINIYIILLFSCINFTSCAQSNIPEKFKETEIPKKNSEESRKLNYSQNEFQVKFENGKLKVQEYKYERETELEIEN
jgi:hypothetical protein